jgi:hypothetical protein
MPSRRPVHIPGGEAARVLRKILVWQAEKSRIVLGMKFEA